MSELLCFDPAGYNLITPIPFDPWRPMNNIHRQLFRINVQEQIPTGYVAVTHINGLSVFRDNGRLEDKYMALLRYSKHNA